MKSSGATALSLPLGFAHPWRRSSTGSLRQTLSQQTPRLPDSGTSSALYEASGHYPVSLSLSTPGIWTSSDASLTSASDASFSLQVALPALPDSPTLPCDGSVFSRYPQAGGPQDVKAAVPDTSAVFGAAPHTGQFQELSLFRETSEPWELSPLSTAAAAQTDLHLAAKLCRLDRQSKSKLRHARTVVKKYQEKSKQLRHTTESKHKMLGALLVHRDLLTSDLANILQTVQSCRQELDQQRLANKTLLRCIEQLSEEASGGPNTGNVGGVGVGGGGGEGTGSIASQDTGSSGVWRQSDKSSNNNASAVESVVSASKSPPDCEAQQSPPKEEVKKSWAEMCSEEDTDDSDDQTSFNTQRDFGDNQASEGEASSTPGPSGSRYEMTYAQSSDKDRTHFPRGPSIEYRSWRRSNYRQDYGKYDSYSALMQENHRQDRATTGAWSGQSKASSSWSGHRKTTRTQGIHTQDTPATNAWSGVTKTRRTQENYIQDTAAKSPRSGQIKLTITREYYGHTSTTTPSGIGRSSNCANGIHDSKRPSKRRKPERTIYILQKPVGKTLSFPEGSDRGRNLSDVQERSPRESADQLHASTAAPSGGWKGPKDKGLVLEEPEEAVLDKKQYQKRNHNGVQPKGQSTNAKNNSLTKKSEIIADRGISKQPKTASRQILRRNQERN